MELLGKASRSTVATNGEKLKNLRVRKGLTIPELELETKVSRNTISKAERGGPVRLSVVRSLAAWFAVEYHSLLATDPRSIVPPSSPEPPPTFQNRVRITIDLPFESVTVPGGKIDELIAFLREYFKDGDGPGPTITPGSVILEWILSARDLLILHELFSSGALDRFRVKSLVISLKHYHSKKETMIEMRRDKGKGRASIKTLEEREFTTLIERSRELYKSGRFESIDLAIQEAMKQTDNNREPPSE